MRLREDDPETLVIVYRVRVMVFQTHPNYLQLQAKGMEFRKKECLSGKALGLLSGASQTIKAFSFSISKACARTQFLHVDVLNWGS